LGSSYQRKNKTGLDKDSPGGHFSLGGHQTSATHSIFYPGINDKFLFTLELTANPSLPIAKKRAQVAPYFFFDLISSERLRMVS